MKNENEIIVGLDIGTTKIACCIGKRGENGKVHILGIGKSESPGVIRGAVVNITDTAESIKKAVRQASEQASTDVSEVYVGIAGQHIKSVQKQGSFTIPEDHHQITREDVEQLKNDQKRLLLGPGDEVIHIFPQNYYVDGNCLDGVNPVGVAGKLLQADFHIVTGNIDNIKHIYESVELAGYAVKGMVLEPVASAYSVLDNLERNAGVALVDIGGGTTDVAIFHEGVIRHTSVLPLAGMSITEDIRRSCNIMRNQAESLKVKFGSCLPSLVNENDVISIPGIHGMPQHEISMKTLATIIKTRTNVILEQVAYEIQESHYAQSLIAGVVITGGGSRLQHIKSLSELVTGKDTRIGTPDEHIDPATDKTILEEMRHPMYATCIGLALYGLEELEQTQAANLRNNKKAEPETKTAPEPKNPNDIFADFPEPTAPQPEEQPETTHPQPEAEKDQKVSKREKWERLKDKLFKKLIDDAEE